MLASARSGLEAAHAPFRTGLLEAVERLRQQRRTVVLPTLADSDTSVHQEADDVAIWHRGIGMLFERGAEPFRLADGDRAVGFRDDQAKAAVADSSQRVDAAGPGPGDPDEPSHGSAPPRVPLFAPEHPARPHL